MRPLARPITSLSPPSGVSMAVERGAFWLGIALPCLHVPLLLAAGVDGPNAPVLVSLWAAHALALLVGARYDPPGDRGER